MIFFFGFLTLFFNASFSFIFLLNKMVLSMKIYILYFFYVVVILSAFGLSSACYDIVLFIVLLRYFICAWAIQTDKADLISQIYQIMVVVSILKS